MNINPEQLERRNPRLEGFDYGLPGMYFVTICTQDRACLFGAIHDHEMHLNDAGRMILEAWQQLPTFYEGIDVDAFVVMPNHVHGIVQIVGRPPVVAPANDPSPNENPSTQNPATSRQIKPPWNLATHGRTRPPWNRNLTARVSRTPGVCVCRAAGDRAATGGCPYVCGRCGCGDDVAGCGSPIQIVDHRKISTWRV
jgi:hypothetical protein